MVGPVSPLQGRVRNHQEADPTDERAQEALYEHFKPRSLYPYFADCVKWIDKSSSTVTMKVLCVAEKPSIARSISTILSGGQLSTRASPNRFIKNFDFTYPQTNSIFTVTSVSGHLTSHDFGEAHRQWHTCDPFALFDAPIETKISADAKTIERNLQNEARNADMLMIWTDCDREGEHIGAEIASVCRRVKGNIIVKRARFSAIIPQQIHNAAQRPVELDRRQADAVEARIILDLRIGSAFTRMQTFALQNRIPQLGEKREPVSYGPCQFPTLGFVVSRYTLVKSFNPELFWYIFLSLYRPTSSSEGGETVFKWRRGQVFEYNIAASIYRNVLNDPVTRVLKVTQKPTKKWKPLPLTTVELQKAGSRLLKLAPKKILDIAEKLYQQGFLSYPRTETDQFDAQFDHKYFIHKQTVDLAWGNFATLLDTGNGYGPPRRGNNNDKAHPPIHPTAHAANLAGDEKRVYEFVTRRYLACCSKDAEGWETTVEVECWGEIFTANGLRILAQNFLEVYVYDKWTGKEIPEFREGEEFIPTVCELKEGQTSPPNYLTEADLVTLMDKNGIGTDATIAQHIQTIIDREYVIERMDGATKHLIPSTLGIGLIEGYDQIGFERSLSKPQLRRETERCMVQVCEGVKAKQIMLEESIEQYKDMYVRARSDFAKVVSSVNRYIQGNGQHAARGGRGGGPRGRGRGGRGGGGGGGGGGNNGGDNEGGSGGGAVRGRGSARARGVEAPRRRGRPRKLAPPQQPVAVENDGDFILNDSPPPPPPAPTSRARQPRPPAPPILSDESDVKNCKCGIPAKQLTVVKESASKGQKFWTCPKETPESCGFFEWVNVSPSGPAVVPSKRPLTDRSTTNVAPDIRQCSCSIPASQKTVHKEGPNTGRVFWTCYLPQGDPGRCNFFAWDDEPAGDGSNGAKIASSGGPSGNCYKCDKPGHWANECPNGAGQSKRMKSFGDQPNNTGTTSGDECFKCGQMGHWSGACPDSTGTSLLRTSSTNSKGSKRGRGSTRARGGRESKRGRGGKTKNNTFSAPDDF